MTYVLGSDFRYIGNRGTGKGYVVSARAGHAVVNLDAMELLTSEDAGWHGDPDYAEFFEQAKALRWLVPSSTASPSVRWVDQKFHLQRVQYEVNLVCNLECMHCYCSSSPRAPAGHPTEFVLDLIRQSADLGVMYFDITGGEPLVRKDMVQLLESARDRGMIPSLFTNCTLVTPKVAQALRDAGVASVQTSLDARTPALHDEFRGKKGAFDRAVRGIEALKSVDIPIRVSVSLNRRNVHEAEAMMRFMEEDLAVQFHLDHVIPAGRSREQTTPLELSNEEFYRVVRKLTGGRTGMTGKVCDSPSLSATNGHIDPACGVGATYMFIKYDGRAALCPTMTEAESPDFAQADLTRMSLRDAWERHPTFQRFRGMQCENSAVCPAGTTCRGGCRSNAYLLHGEVNSPEEISCNVHKNSGDDYRPFLVEYERMRLDGRLPAISERSPRAVRRLPVLA